MNKKHANSIILKRINFSEADRILTVLIEDGEKRSMLAKGVRKSKSKLAGGLELFSVSELSFIDGKSDIKTIVSARLVRHFKQIVADVALTMAAYDVLKAADMYTEHEANEAYYASLISALDALNDDMDVAVVELWYYARVMSIHGSAVNCEKPLNADGFADDQMYVFSFDDMCFLQNDSGDIEPNQIKLLRLVERADDPNKLKSIENVEEMSVLLAKLLKQSALSHKA